VNRVFPRPSAVRRLAGLAATTEWDARPDAKLLDRFARSGEHPAFEAILRRHGPLVLGVCRLVLGRPEDAEDAFQATFLVLVRKARSVARGERLGLWLYGVAFRVARRARERAARTVAQGPQAKADKPPAMDPAGTTAARTDAPKPTLRGRTTPSSKASGSASNSASRGLANSTRASRKS
jgi:DNA-directed RNA polymerase specialized sigma24 family protein